MGDEQPSYEDLIELVNELQEQNDYLTKKLENETEIRDLGLENEELRQKIEADQVTVLKLRDENEDIKVRIKVLTNEKLEADKRIKNQTKKIEDLEREIVDKANKNR
jgi:predicted RNase H-like nuclease (RuvC/YqgF family)